MTDLNPPKKVVNQVSILTLLDLNYNYTIQFNSNKTKTLLLQILQHWFTDGKHTKNLAIAE